MILLLIMEGLLGLMLVLAPWALGAVQPVAEFGLMLGLLGLLGLWGLRVLLEGKLRWSAPGIILGLGGLFLLGLVQQWTLPNGVLSFLSPGSAHIQATCCPTEPEIVSGLQPEPTTLASGRGSVSVNSWETQKKGVRLLAALLLFACVQANLATPAVFRHLCLLAVLNGTALAIFGLIQHFATPAGQVYGYFQTEGAVFGPFVNRNHFAFYQNLCIGLGVGLFLSLHDPRNSFERQTSNYNVLRHPAGMWLIVALLFMAASVFVSLSRGGMVSLGLGLLVGLWLYWRRKRSSTGWANWGLIGVISVLGLGLLTWLGLEPVENRLGTLTSAEILRDDRLRVWSNLLSLLPQFPVLGSGFGTFEFVEPLSHRSDRAITSLMGHAHNEYLNLLVEGGLLGLVFGVGILVVVFRQGLWQLQQGGTVAALAAGGLVAFTAALLQSFTEFGFTIPANTLLCVVLAAQLCGEGARKPVNTSSSAVSRDMPFWQRIGFAVVVVVVGLLLCQHLWRELWAEQYRLAGARLVRQGGKEPKRMLAYYQQAAAWTPEDGQIRTALGDVYLKLYDQPDFLPDLQGEARRQQWLFPGLREQIAARDRCPLLESPHLRLADKVGALTRGDSIDAYLNRVHFVLKADPNLWYLAGRIEQRNGDLAAALASWQNCLRLDASFLNRIVADLGADFPRQRLFRELLPEQPEVLLAAADRFAEDPQTVRSLLARALKVLEATPEISEAAYWQQRGQILNRLGQFEQARKAYRRAIQCDPNAWPIRLEYAQILVDRDAFDEAQRQLRRLLALFPDNRQAQSLHKIVVEAQVRRKE